MWPDEHSSRQLGWGQDFICCDLQSLAPRTLARDAAPETTWWGIYREKAQLQESSDGNFEDKRCAGGSTALGSLKNGVSAADTTEQAVHTQGGEPLLPAMSPFLQQEMYFLVLLPMRHKRRYKSHRVSNRHVFNELTKEFVDRKTMLDWN